MGVEGIGASVVRKEDRRFITGKGRYVDDIKLVGLTHAHFIRSPHANAMVKGIDASEALKMPAEYAARLLVDHGTQDWRDVITDLLPTLGRPTLVVGGALGTLFPPESQEWIAAKIPGAKLAMFSAEELGSHFMFWENPAKFDAVVREFLG